MRLKTDSQFFFAQDLELNSTSMGRISSLPKSISRERTSFEKIENPPKLPIGPTTLSPGPILLKQEITAVTLVVKSKLSTDIAMQEPIIIRMYIIK